MVNNFLLTRKFFFKRICSLILFFITIPTFATPFITTNGIHFIKNQKEYYFIGCNVWYGAIIGVKNNPYGNRKRLISELNFLKKNNITNLRILIGAEQGDSNIQHVRPYLQPSVNTIDNKVLDGLDFLIYEMKKRGMKGVFYLTNSWDWSGGYGFYLKKSNVPSPINPNWEEYCNYASLMNINKRAQQLYWNFIKKIIPHYNKYTKTYYNQEPTIMAWQICNEPRPFRKDCKSKMLEFLSCTAKLIKSLDPNHLVSAGSEGIIGCENDTILYEQIARDKNIDYLTIHIWPKNWNWVEHNDIKSSLPIVLKKTADYIHAHLEIANKVLKPLVIEEFGYPRESNSYDLNSSTNSRDIFYQFIFNYILNSTNKHEAIGGCNFWSWGGYGKPHHIKWHVGDPYIGDPPHEPQGWYSVFLSDTTTMSIIQSSIKKLK